MAMNIVGTPYTASALLLGHRLERRQRVEACRGVHHRRARRDAAEVSDPHPEAVVQRHRDAHTVDSSV